MEGQDFLGTVGRQFVNACVRVGIYEKGKVRKCTKDEAVHRVDVESAQRRKCGEGKASTVGSSQVSNRLCEGKNDEVKAYSTEKEILQLLSATRGILEGADVGDRGSMVLRSINHPVEQDDESDKRLVSPDEEGVSDDYIDYGSGFMVDHNTLGLGFIACYMYVYILTCYHVIEQALFDESKEVCISNRVINKLPCEIVGYNSQTDLALLWCCDQKESLSGIPRLQLSEEELLTGQEVFSFGYPLSHPVSVGNEALFIRGCVSGIRTGFGKPLYDYVKVLDCAVSHGCSGSPAFCWSNGGIKAMGIIFQKHKKDILEPEEEMLIEEIRNSLGAATIADAPNPQIATQLLVLKLKDALETHTQFNKGNVMTGKVVKDFCIKTIKDGGIPPRLG